MKKIYLYIIVLLALFYMVGCNSLPDTKKIVYDEEVINIAVNDLSNGKFNPLFAEDESDKIICDIVFEPLFNYNNKNIEPKLMEKLEISDDELTYNIKLRENVKWHNLLDFTAEDVIQTIKFSLSEINTKPYYYYLSNILGVDRYVNGYADEIYGIEKVDDYNIKIRLKKRDEYFLDKLSKVYIIQAHQIENIRKDSWLNYDELWKNPIGTGAYSLNVYMEEQWVFLEKNEKYWSDTSNVKKYIIHASNDEFAKKNFLNGNMNIITDVLFNESDSSEYLEQRATLEELETPVSQVIIANNSSKYLSNKFVRKALMHALERDIFFDIFSESNSNKHKETLRIYEYNPNKAIEILTKMVGWEYIDGKMFFNDEPVKLEFLYTNSDKISRFCYPIIEENFESIGIEIEAVLVNSNELHKRLQSDLYDLALYNIHFENAYDIYNYVCSGKEQIGKNYSNYSNTLAEKFADEYYLSSFADEKEGLLNKLIDILVDDVPILYMFDYKRTCIISKNLASSDDSGFSKYCNINKWNIYNK